MIFVEMYCNASLQNIEIGIKIKFHKSLFEKKCKKKPRLKAGVFPEMYLITSLIRL
jgi:hypothetical protein